MSESKNCPKCGSKIPTNINFCTNCGTPLPHDSSEQKTPPPQSKDHIATSETDTTAHDTRTSKPVAPSQPKTDTIRCPQCKKEIPSHFNYCPFCGVNLTHMKKTKLRDLRICPQCGGENPEGSSFCIHCGFKIDQSSTSPTIQLKIAEQNPQLIADNFNGFEVTPFLFHSWLKRQNTVPLNLGAIRRSQLLETLQKPLPLTTSEFFSYTPPRKTSNLIQGFSSVFNIKNLIHFGLSYIITVLIFSLWFFFVYHPTTQRQADKIAALNISIYIVPILSFSLILTLIIMSPLILTVYFAKREYGYDVIYQINGGRSAFVLLLNFFLVLFFQYPFLFRFADLKANAHISLEELKRPIGKAMAITTFIAYSLGFTFMAFLGFPQFGISPLIQITLPPLTTQEWTNMLLLVETSIVWTLFFLTAPFSDMYAEIFRQWDTRLYLLSLTILALLILYILFAFPPLL